MSFMASPYGTNMVFMPSAASEKTGQPCTVKPDPMPERDELTYEEAQAEYSLFFQRWDEWPYSDPSATTYLEKHYPEVLERLRGGTPDEIYDQIEWE